MTAAAVPNPEAARALTALIDAVADAVADRVTATVLAHMDAPRLPPATLRLEDAADYLQMSVSTLRRLIDDGKLEPVRIGRVVTIPRERLDALLRVA